MVTPAQRRRQHPGPEATYVADGRPCAAEQLSLRTMNFGQPWRSAAVEEVAYAAVLPGSFLLEYL